MLDAKAWGAETLLPFFPLLLHVSKNLQNYFRKFGQAEQLLVRNGQAPLPRVIWIALRLLSRNVPRDLIKLLAQPPKRRHDAGMLAAQGDAGQLAQHLQQSRAPAAAV